MSHSWVCGRCGGRLNVGAVAETAVWADFPRSGQIHAMALAHSWKMSWSKLQVMLARMRFASVRAIGRGIGLPADR